MLQVTDTSLSKIMQNLGFRYMQHINRKQKKTGHLFPGRFNALLLDEAFYLLWPTTSTSTPCAPAW